MSKNIVTLKSCDLVYRSVTASHPASHVAVAITLNAQASSLKMNETELARYNQLYTVTVTVTAAFLMSLLQ